MNRYALMFAFLVASSFAVVPPQVGDHISSPGDTAATAKTGAKDKGGASSRYGAPPPGRQAPVAFIGSFLGKAVTNWHPGETPTILFATVPHPLETHLGASFDHNLDAMQDGLQETGYLFDSAWIPWASHEPRERFDDDQKEKSAKVVEDEYPGILLFRSNNPKRNAYLNGVVVFLISEKPTQGIALSQVETASRLIKDSHLQLPATIRILGPTYSGSFVSLVAMAKLLGVRNPMANFVIRSGSVSVGDAAREATCTISSVLPGRSIDFGSTMHDYRKWIDAVTQTLDRMDIKRREIAVLGEGESLYGSYALNTGNETKIQENDCVGAKTDSDSLKGMWRLAYPRDISSLRAGYESQGIFDSLAPARPWKRLLNLRGDDQSEGDTIRSFGGSSTMAVQEGVLLGISEFLRMHGTRAVVISATNEEDLYFLAQFFHAHNGDLRVVIIGSSRIFMRGSTAEFRGDLIVDDFPMLPKLPDWTGAGSGGAARIFADDVSEGTFFAVVDMFYEPSGPASDWFPEYNAPLWSADPPAQRPPMYIVALGSKSTWPLTEYAETPVMDSNSDPWQVEMPFQLFGRLKQSSQTPPAATPFHTGRLWKLCFAGLAFLTGLYCSCFWFANPVTRIACAGFQPSTSWRFWLCRVTIPAAVAVGAFQVLAWPVEIPSIASPTVVVAWHFAEAFAFAAPLAIALSAMAKALTRVNLDFNPGMAVSFLPACVAAVSAVCQGILHPDPFAGRSVGQILNAYREMRFESGLSLVPTLLLFFLAVLVWISQAGSGAALLDAAPPLPRYPDNPRISRGRAARIVAVGRPLPHLLEVKGIWIIWAVLAAVTLFFHESRSFKTVTTLESYGITRFVVCVAITIVLLILFDVVQFLQLWDELQGLLRALSRQQFRRSFVPIEDFKWPNLWSFSGISFRDRRALDAALADCVLELSQTHKVPPFQKSALRIDALRTRYNRESMPRLTRQFYIRDRIDFFANVSNACTAAAKLVQSQTFMPVVVGVAPSIQALQRAIGSLVKKEDAFRADREQVAALPGWQQAAERLICLMYIGFIQAVIGRLHTLLVSVASMFSLLVLGIAIYPFVPFSPLLVAGTALLAGIGWAFFKVFSEMDTDPVLARIVNGDDRKLQTNFYFKFAEALALPLLALGSSVLPGGTGRLLELAQTVLNHAQ